MANLHCVPLLLVALLCTFAGAYSDGQNKLTAAITINAGQRYQTIDGFGFSEAFQRAALVHGKFGLSPANQRRVLELLFSDETGAGATILRNGIGSSTSYERDFMKSIALEPPGSPSAAPAYVWDGYDADQVWLTREALEYGALRYVYADAWSAPAYMKSNGNDSNGGHLCGGGSSSADCAATGDWRQAYADYLVQYLRFYREREGIEITHVGWLNEPDLNQTYASMLSDGFEAGEFAPVLRRALDAARLGHIHVVCCEATGWTRGAALLAELQTVAGAEEALDVYTAHGYSADPARPLPTKRKVWQTEWADLDARWNPAWDDLGKQGEGLGWANKIQESLVFGNVSAWLYWIGAEQTPFNSAMIQLQNETFSVSARLWAFAQFSRFVKPGAVRVEAGSSLAFVGTSAFLNEDGRLAVQLVNNGHRDLDVRLSMDGLQGGWDRPCMWLTKNQHNLTKMDVDAGSPSADVGPIAGLLPARSMATFII